MVGKLQTWFDRFRPHPYARRQPLILINGLAEQAEILVPQPPLLAAALRRPHAQHAGLRRPRPAPRIDQGLPISVDYLVEQLHQYLIDFVQTPPYHLVAASLGGKVAVEYAVRYPEDVARMVLTVPLRHGRRGAAADRRGRPPQRPAGAGGQRLLQPAAPVDPRLLALLPAAVRQPPLATRPAADHPRHDGPRVRDRLALVKQPTLLVSGAEDKIVDPAAAAEAAQLLPDGHFLPIPQLRPRAADGEALADQPAGRPLPDRRPALAATSPESTAAGQTQPRVM